jgi:hypothetical protein
MANELIFNEMMTSFILNIWPKSKYFILAHNVASLDVIHRNVNNKFIPGNSKKKDILDHCRPHKSDVSFVDGKNK